MPAKPDNKIKLKAIYRKNNSLMICDQDGRQFDGTSSYESRFESRPVATIIDVTLEAGNSRFERPRATITISVPLEVEERLPEYLQEILLSDSLGNPL